MAAGKKEGLYSVSSSEDTGVCQGATRTTMSTLEDENENHRRTCVVVNELEQGDK